MIKFGFFFFGLIKIINTLIIRQAETVSQSEASRNSFLETISNQVDCIYSDNFSIKLDWRKWQAKVNFACILVDKPAKKSKKEKINYRFEFNHRVPIRLIDFFSGFFFDLNYGFPSEKQSENLFFSGFFRSESYVWFYLIMIMITKKRKNP